MQMCGGYKYDTALMNKMMLQQLQSPGFGAIAAVM